MASNATAEADTDRLGGRFALYRPESLTGSARKLYEHAQSTIVPESEKAGFTALLADGRLVGPFNPMLASPDICAAVLALQKAEGAATSLSPVTRQVVILSVGAVWKAPYELYAHTAEARSVGLQQDVIDLLVKGETATALAEADQTVQRFTLALVGERQVSDDVFEAAKRALGEKGIVDLILLAGCYQLICSLLNAIAIPVPHEKEDSDA